jgi:hypothetical protein
MSYDLNNRSALCSRRRLLIGAVAAATAATALGTDPRTAAAMKISETAVGYQDHPNGDRQCNKCAQFQPPSSCKMVDGTISPRGYCRIFMPIRSSAVRLHTSLSTG